MSNDISGINSGRSHQTTDRQTQGVARDSTSTETRTNPETGSQDKVVLTDMAARMKSLEQKLAKEPQVDQAHVARVRDAIKRGEYQVNPDRVADKMMGFERDM
jgi:negative regulator of flagellin synthesis FlgM